jgi:transposase
VASPRAQQPADCRKHGRGFAHFSDWLGQRLTTERILEQHRYPLPERVRRLVLAFWSEAGDLEGRMRAIEQELEEIARQDPVIQTLRQIPGIGVLTATRRGEAGNSHVPYENAENDWLPVCESSIMARTHRRSTSQAGYTTAAAPLRHYGSAAELDMREESIYG